MKKIIMIAMMLLSQTGFALEQDIQCQSLEKEAKVQSFEVLVHKQRGVSYSLQMEGKGQFLGYEGGVTDHKKILKFYAYDSDFKKQYLYLIPTKYQKAVNHNFNSRAPVYGDNMNGCPSKMTLDLCFELGYFDKVGKIKEYTAVLTFNNQPVSYLCK